MAQTSVISMIPLETHLKELQSVLLNLSPTGPSGFEGLIAEVLQEIKGVPFQLSASGRQDGIDGASTSTDETIVFECKLCKGPVARSGVVMKLTDFNRHRKATDAVWILATTGEVRAQTATDLNTDGESYGILVTLLDWHNSKLSRLATALAIASDTTVRFLENSKNIDQNERGGIRDALSEIQRCPSYKTTASDIQRELSVHIRSLDMARQANRRILVSALSSPSLAKNIFGQSLTPTSKSGTLQQRDDLTHPIAETFTETPNGKVRVIYGNEGCGKSWAVVQTWLQLEDPPLTLFVPAQKASWYTHIEDKYETLIRLLIEQTEANPSERYIERWMDRWEKMKSKNNLPQPRLVVILDGLNQRPSENSPSMIENLALQLEKIGGALIITVRTNYYLTSLKPCLSIGQSEVNVPEWTICERNEILESRGIDPSTLSKNVLSCLTNPRLLGISLNLLSNEVLEGLHELDVSRLLFEHIRTCASGIQGASPPDELARKLAIHAKEVRQRLKRQQSDDLLVFEKNGLAAVSDCRFFESLPEDSMKYRLHPDGFELALGFVLVEELQRAKRNNELISEVAANLLEPIAALDESPDVVVAGLHVLCLDDLKFDEDLATCLLLELARAQNIKQHSVPALKMHVRRRVGTFLRAVEVIHLSGERYQNVDFLEDALQETLNDKKNQKIIDGRIRRWLKTYTCSANFGWEHVHRASMEKEEAQRQQKKYEKKIESNLKSLSTDEEKFLSGLQECNGDVFALHSLAFQLLAGRHLAPFALELISARFISALSSARPHSDDLFLELCRFNNCDWSEMCMALTKESNWLRQSNISKIGRRTRAGVLDATGGLAEAKESVEIGNFLRNQNPPSYSSNTKASLCKTDPCDPTSPETNNLEDAITWLAVLRPAEYATDNQVSKGFVDLKHVLLPVARHRPKLITDTMRRIINDVASRSGPALRQGLIQLERHRALITPAQTKKFIQIWQVPLEKDRFSGTDEMERNTFRQYCLVMCFHNLAGDRQLELLMSDPQDKSLLLCLLALCKPATASTLDKVIEATDWTPPNARRIRVILAFITSTKPTLSQAQATSISGLFDSDDSNLALYTLMLAMELKNKAIIQRFLDSSWAPRRTVEDCSIWSDWRSRAFIQAGCLELININDVFDAIMPEHFGLALRFLKGAAAPRIAKLLKDCIGMEALQVPNFDNMTISWTTRNDLGDPYPVTSVDEHLPLDDGATINLLLTETPTEWRKRQERAQNRGQKLIDHVRSSGFGALLSDADSQGISLLLESDRRLGQVLTDYLTHIKASERPPFRNLAFTLAYALAHLGNDSAAESLLTCYKFTSFSIRLIDGGTEIPAEVLYAWRGSSTKFLDKHRFTRLDEGVTDHIMAQEVLAAELGCKRETLHSYIEDRSKRPEPSLVARAIIVAGFMGENSASTDLLEHFKNADGFLGKVTRTARFAYRRNIWAQHWYKQMQNAQTPTDFWRSQMLFEEIVDGRFYIWFAETKANSVARQHQSLIRTRVRARSEKWQKIRECKLFGASIPDRYVLASLCGRNSPGTT